jgi:hypothetical protein
MRPFFPQRSRRPHTALCLVLLFLCGCAATAPAPDPDSELWTGRVTGDIIGDLRFYLPAERARRSGALPVEGRLIVRARVRGESENATVRMSVTGTLADGIFRARISGRGRAEGGYQFYLSGTMQGTVSQTEGFGTMEVSTKGFQGTGDWVLHRSDNS